MTVYEAGTTTPIAATMYDADDVVLLNPLTADAQGTVVFFLDDAQRVDLYVEADGYAASTATVDVVGEDTFSSPSVTGSLTFPDAGSRIVADFSNATIADRLLFQSSTTNGATTVGVLPNGTSTQAQASYYNHPTPTSAGALTVGVNGAEARLVTSNPGGGEPTTLVLRSALGALLSLATATGVATFLADVVVPSITKGAAPLNQTMQACLAATTVPAATTSYAAPGAGSAVTTENQRQTPIPRATTVRNLYLSTAGAQPGDGTLVATVRKNGVDTTVTVTVAAGAAAGTVTDLTHSVAFAAGDLLSLKLVNGSPGTASATIIGWSVTLDA